MGRKTKDSGVDGLLVVDKPAGWTSHDVVANCRGAFGQRRAGHSGTLDPDATGVLLIGFGQVTKLLSLLTILPKRYTGEVVLGAETSTLDSSGDVLRTYEMGAVTVADVRAAATAFFGDILQIPPMVSALQVDGVRLHELALRRPEIGSFRVEEGCVVDDRLGSQRLLTPAAALRDYPSVVVEGDTVAQVRNGRVLPLAVFGLGATHGEAAEDAAVEDVAVEDAAGDVTTIAARGRPWAVVDGEGTLLAVYERHRGGTAKPAVVLAR